MRSAPVPARNVGKIGLNEARHAPDNACDDATRPSESAGESLPRMRAAAAVLNEARPSMGMYSLSRFCDTILRSASRTWDKEKQMVSKGVQGGADSSYAFEHVGLQVLVSVRANAEVHLAEGIAGVERDVDAEDGVDGRSGNRVPGRSGHLNQGWGEARKRQSAAG